MKNIPYTTDFGFKYISVTSHPLPLAERNRVRIPKAAAVGRKRRKSIVNIVYTGQIRRVRYRNSLESVNPGMNVSKKAVEMVWYVFIMPLPNAI
jgi:hypothetical protein